MKSFYESGDITGHLQIRERLISDGSIVSEWEDKNVVLLSGKRRLLGYLRETPTEPTNIEKIVLGTDVGNGTIMEPEMANENLTEDDQVVLYESKSHEFSHSQPTPDSVRFVATLSGEDIMMENPSVPNVVYNSATLRMGDGTAFAYRRFLPRTISSLVYVDIIWTITVH